MVSSFFIQVAYLSFFSSVTSAYTLVNSYDYTNWYSSFTFETVSFVSSAHHLLTLDRPPIRRVDL